MKTVPTSVAATNGHRTGSVDGVQPDAAQPEDRPGTLCFGSASTVGVVDSSARTVTSNTPTTAANTANAPRKRGCPLKTFMLFPFMLRAMDWMGLVALTTNRYDAENL